ncbi:short-subunit dehydrogenase [Stackebrandtia albiflava]|uniref:Short-subunit dehydrogenase n=2 Tax=Stackebrandtia albiflava TaxID=406432 RepID=A0A562V177_9ACTN|nr:short-subunit dehydrogenase [Stackebrandtia albiflava]
MNPIALVTGAGGGIGRVTAIRLSRAGYRVALTARDPDRLERAAAECPGPTLVLPVDLTAPGAVESVFADTEDEWGTVGVLVLGAGTATSSPVTRITDEEWRRQLDVNLTAPFRCVRRAVPGMRAAGHGRIVAVASVAAKRGDPYVTAYSAAKHGLLGMVRSVAAELAGTGITVNAVCPGYVDTPMTEESVANIAARTGKTPDEARRLLAGKQPIGRLITPEEVAAAVQFCIDSPGVTGQGLNIDGGAVQS